MLGGAESRGHHLQMMLQLLLLGVSFQTPRFLGAQDLLYVASQEAVTVSVIDTRNNELLETVDHAYSYLHQAYVGHRLADVLNKFSMRDIIRQGWY